MSVNSRAQLLVFVGATLITLGCERASPTQPQPLPPATQVVIGGLNRDASTHLRPGQSARLSATAMLTDGSQSDCTQGAQWSSSDVQVVRFAAPGEVVAAGPGSVTVRAACGGVEGRFNISVRYDLRGSVRRPDGRAVEGAFVAAESVGRAATTDSAGAFALTELSSREFSASVSAVGYDTTSHQLVWDGREETTGVQLTARPLEGVRILDAAGKICQYGPGSVWYPDWYHKYCVPVGAMRFEDRYEFTVPRDGRLRVDTYWGLDYNDLLHIQLRCNGPIIHQITQRDSSSGKAFEIPARAACAYELKLTPSVRYPYVSYRLVITLDP